MIHLAAQHVVSHPSHRYGWGLLVRGLRRPFTVERREESGWVPVFVVTSDVPYIVDYEAPRSDEPPTYRVVRP